MKFEVIVDVKFVIIVDMKFVSSTGESGAILAVSLHNIATLDHIQAVTQSH